MSAPGIRTIVVVVVSLLVTASLAGEMQDGFTVTDPSDIALSELKGYETWPSVAGSQSEDGIRAVPANPVMINAYREGIPIRLCHQRHTLVKAKDYIFTASPLR